MDKKTKMVKVLALGSAQTSLKVCLKSAAVGLFCGTDCAVGLSNRHRQVGVVQVVSKLNHADTFNKISGV